MREKATACAPCRESARHNDCRGGRGWTLMDMLARQADSRLIQDSPVDDGCSDEVQAVLRLVQATGAVGQAEVADPLISNRVAVPLIAHQQAGRAIDLKVEAGRADSQALWRRHVGGEGGWVK